MQTTDRAFGLIMLIVPGCVSRTCGAIFVGAFRSWPPESPEPLFPLPPCPLLSPAFGDPFPGDVEDPPCPECSPDSVGPLPRSAGPPAPRPKPPEPAVFSLRPHRPPAPVPSQSCCRIRAPSTWSSLLHGKTTGAHDFRPSQVSLREIGHHLPDGVLSMPLRLIFSPASTMLRIRSDCLPLARINTPCSASAESPLSSASVNDFMSGSCMAFMLP